MIRPNRRGEANTMIAPINPPIPTTVPMCIQGIPAIKHMAITMSTKTTAEPKSPWIRLSTKAAPVAAPIGTTVRRQSFRTSFRRVRMSATPRMTDNLKSSDGWKVIPPSETQEFASLTSWLHPGTNGSAIKPRPTAQMRGTRRRKSW